MIDLQGQLSPINNQFFIVVVSIFFIAFILILVLLYRFRSKKNSEDDEECEQQAKLFSSVHIGSSLAFNSNIYRVQPSLKSKITSVLPWKTGVIDHLKPEAVSEYRGKLNFSISFDNETNILYVHIIEAIDLPVRDITGSSDPYVRVFFLPGAQFCQRTKVHRRNLNPKFQQILSFPGLAAKKMGHMTMVMQVMDYDRFSNDDPIGEIILPMRSVKFDNAPVYWKHLQRPTVDKENVGELMLSLCYLPEVNKLAVSVIKARGLPKKDKLGSSDPYVKLWLVQQGVKLEKQKTCVKPQTLAPIFNESFVFNLPDNYKNDVNLVAMMMDYDMISSNDEIGHAIVGPLGPECGTKQWNEVFCHPEIPFARWHKLLPKW